MQLSSAVPFGSLAALFFDVLMWDRILVPLSLDFHEKHALDMGCSDNFFSPTCSCSLYDLGEDFQTLH